VPRGRVDDFAEDASNVRRAFAINKVDPAKISRMLTEGESARR
jgi:hypothetical protein